MHSCARTGGSGCNTKGLLDSGDGQTRGMDSQRDKRRGGGAKKTSKNVAGFATLTAYKEKYKPLLMVKGLGLGGKTMPKQSAELKKSRTCTLNSTCEVVFVR